MRWEPCVWVATVKSVRVLPKSRIAEDSTSVPREGSRVTQPTTRWGSRPRTKRLLQTA